MRHIRPAALLVLAACSAATDHRADDALARHVAAGHHDAAVTELERALRRGALRPSHLLDDERLAPLLADPATRPRVRQLLHDHACEPRVKVARAGAPGRPLTIRLTLVDRRTGEPIPGGLVECVQVGVEGFYAQDDDGWNPRRFGTARTDARGRVTFETVHPGYYAPEYDPDGIEPRHVHYTTEAAGYRDWGGEILFAGDPRLTADRRAEAERHGTPVVTVERRGGADSCHAILRLQPE